MLLWKRGGGQNDFRGLAIGPIVERDVSLEEEMENARNDEKLRKKIKRIF